MEKQELIDKMKVVLASAFSLYLKAHNYHWNVTGQNFKQYHDFFGQFYEDVHDSVDLYAEHIRALKAVSPGSLKRFAELTIISDEIAVPSPKFMFVRLSQDNEKFLAELREARNIADSLNEFGVVNFLEDRIDFHEKMQWMIDAYTE
jgi:starvation-inducible DNA-binding protein